MELNRTIDATTYLRRKVAYVSTTTMPDADEPDGQVVMQLSAILATRTKTRELRPSSYGRCLKLDGCSFSSVQKKQTRLISLS